MLNDLADGNSSDYLLGRHSHYAASTSNLLESLGFIVNYQNPCLD